MKVGNQVMSNIQKILRIPIHPLLFGVYPVVQFLAFNIKEVEIAASFRILIIVVIGVLALFFLLRVLVRDWDRSAVMVSIAALLFFSYGHVYSVFKDVEIFGVGIGRHRFLLIFFLLLLVCGWIWVLKKMKNLDITIGLNVISIILLVVPLYQISNYELRFRTSYSSPNIPEVSTVAVEQSTQFPDIYYIIVDAYTREDTLRNNFDFDNSPFLEALEVRGFYIADCSQSNYTFTRMSLSSALNINYVQDFYDRHDLNGFTSLIRNNYMRAFLESVGYKSVAFNTGYPFTQWQDAAYYFSIDEQNISDLYLPGGLQEYEALFIRTTMGLVLLDLNTIYQSRLQQFIEESPRRIKYALNEYNMEELESVPSIPGPKFVFAHITVTHFPYVFRDTGEFLPAGINYNEAYLHTIRYTNTRLLEIVDTLLAKSEIPPIIIIQGDHGSEETRDEYERITILNAYYFPGNASDSLYPTITPVNTFRIVLNEYFNQELELLPDVSYFSYWPRILEFERMPENWSGCESNNPR